MNDADFEALRRDLTPKHPTPQRNRDGSLRRWPLVHARKLDGQEETVAEVVTAPGMTLKQAAQKLGVCSDALTHFLETRMPFVAARAAWRRPDTEAVNDTLRTMMAQGATMGEMARAVGLSDTTIRANARAASPEVYEAWLKRNGERYNLPSEKRRKDPRVRLWASLFWAALDAPRRAFVVSWLAGRGLVADFAAVRKPNPVKGSIYLDTASRGWDGGRVRAPRWCAEVTVGGQRRRRRSRDRAELEAWVAEVTGARNVEVALGQGRDVHARRPNARKGGGEMSARVAKRSATSLENYVRSMAPGQEGRALGLLAHANAFLSPDWRVSGREAWRLLWRCMAAEVNVLERTRPDARALFEPGQIGHGQAFARALMEAMDAEPYDYAGAIYMGLAFNDSKRKGQVFTPPHVVEMMTRSLLAHAREDGTPVGGPGRPWLDPCVGSGAFPIGAMRLFRRGECPRLWFEMNDLDPLCADMAFVQYTYAGGLGAVHTGDFLAVRDVYSIEATHASMASILTLRVHRARAQISEACRG